MKYQPVAILLMAIFLTFSSFGAEKPMEDFSFPQISSRVVAFSCCDENVIFSKAAVKSFFADEGKLRSAIRFIPGGKIVCLLQDEEKILKFLSSNYNILPIVIGNLHYKLKTHSNGLNALNHFSFEGCSAEMIETAQKRIEWTREEIKQKQNVVSSAIEMLEIILSNSTLSKNS